MSETTAAFYKAKNATEVLYTVKNIKGLKIYGGGTMLRSSENSLQLETGSSFLFLTNIEDFKLIEKRERFLDFGAGVTLSEILNLGRSNLPEFLYDAIQTIGNPTVRNTATIGGNICASDVYHTLYSPLLALDAKLDIIRPEELISIPFSKFSGIKEDQVLTKIRIPLADWDIESFTRLGPENRITDVSAGFTFLAKTQKDTIIDLRIAWCGKIKLRSNELENLLTGSKVPLSKKSIQTVLEYAENLYDTLAKEYSQSVKNGEILHPMLKAQFMNLLKKNLEKLT